MPSSPQIRALSAVLLAWSCACFTACSWRDDLDGQREVPAGARQQRGSLAGVGALSVHANGVQTVAIDLFAMRPLISGHRQGSLVIEMGSPDFIKYIDGGLREDWLLGVTVAGAAPKASSEVASQVLGLAAELYFPLDEDPGGIEVGSGGLSIRFRAKSAVANQLVSVFLNEHKLGDVRMPSADWQNYSVTAPPSATVHGENKLRFYFRSAGLANGRTSAAAFSRLVIGGSLSEDPAFVVGKTGAGRDDSKVLLVSAPSRLSFYLQLPDAPAQLAFSMEQGSGASVRIQAGASASKEIWRQDAGRERARVNLGAYRAQVVRLDLLSKGAASWEGLRIVLTSDSDVGGDVGKEVTPELPRAQHIVLWSVSSLRSDRMTSVAGRGFQRFLSESFVVPRMQAAVPTAGGANATAMLGRFRSHGSIEASSLTLAERLQAQGVATALFSGNGFVNDSAGFAQGFDTYDNPMRRRHHYGAKTLWRQARKFLSAHSRERTFVHIATVEAHVPYRPDAEALGKFWAGPQPFSPAHTLELASQIKSGRHKPSEIERTYVTALYDASIFQASGAFSAMLEDLPSLHLPGNTVVILVGEHGEQLWERGGFGHGDSLFQESLETTLAIRGDAMQDFRPPSQVSSVDLAPTILQLAGVAPDSGTLGQSVFRNDFRESIRPLFSGLPGGPRSVLLGRFKLIASPVGAIALYDLRADSGELRNLSLTRPTVARALRITLSSFVAFEESWSSPRWGQPSWPLESFARDLGF